MQTRRSLLTFFTALFLLFSLASCKKEDDPNSTATPFTLEKLGDLVMNNGNLGYNAAGEPLIQFNSYVYEWSNTGKAWRKLGGPVSARGVYGGYAQDKRGVYYIADGAMYSCASATDNWVRVRFPGITDDGSMASLVSNDLGDIVILVRDNTDVYRYFGKKGTSAVWNQIASIPGASFTHNKDPSFLCNNGNLYLGGPGGMLDTYLDTNTGRFALLYDKSEPANIRLGKAGYLDYPFFIRSSGTIYIRDGNELFKLDGTVLPAQITKVLTFENPLASKHDITWLKGLGAFVIDDAGDIKMLGTCNKGYDFHQSHISGNINRTDMKVLQEGVGQRGLFSNRKGECFVGMSAGGGTEVYKWN